MCYYYTPLSENKHHILIDDMSIESLKRLQKDGYHPAVVMESSPDNYQCLLTIPKLGTQYDRDVGNRVTEYLNREYGDKKLCGCIHPHRAPSFENQKPKHRRKDGTYPKVRLLFAEQRECKKALALSNKITQQYEEAEARRKIETQKQASQMRIPPGDPAKAYYAHFENICQHITIDDYSRVDAMIALRMRANGHSREIVEETIRSCAPTIRENATTHNWQNYAMRTAGYAFGLAGDRDMARNERFKDMWHRVEFGENMSIIPTTKNNLSNGKNNIRIRINR